MLTWRRLQAQSVQHFNVVWCCQGSQACAAAMRHGNKHQQAQTSACWCQKCRGSGIMPRISFWETGKSQPVEVCVCGGIVTSVHVDVRTSGWPLCLKGKIWTADALSALTTVCANTTHCWPRPQLWPSTGTQIRMGWLQIRSWPTVPPAGTGSAHYAVTAGKLRYAVKSEARAGVQSAQAKIDLSTDSQLWPRANTQQWGNLILEEPESSSWSWQHNSRKRQEGALDLYQLPQRPTTPLHGNPSQPHWPQPWLPLLCASQGLHLQFITVSVPCTSCRVWLCQEWCRPWAGFAKFPKKSLLEGCKWAHVGTVSFPALRTRTEEDEKSNYQVQAWEAGISWLIW